MGLTTDFLHNPEEMSVPYPPLFDDMRSNRGYVDLRGRPELAERIAECCDSDGLRLLLIALAQSASYFFTLGCDLGVQTIQHELFTEENERAVDYRSIEAEKESRDRCDAGDRPDVHAICFSDGMLRGVA